MGKLILGLAYFGFILAVIAAWITHIIISIQGAVATGAAFYWVILVIGIIVPPIGWVHGVGHWFGAF